MLGLDIGEILTPLLHTYGNGGPYPLYRADLAELSVGEPRPGFHTAGPTRRALSQYAPTGLSYSGAPAGPQSAGLDLTGLSNGGLWPGFHAAGPGWAFIIGQGWDGDGARSGSGQGP